MALLGDISTAEAMKINKGIENVELTGLEDQDIEFWKNKIQVFCNIILAICNKILLVTTKF